MVYSRVFLEVIVRDEDLGLLGVSISVTPPQGLPDHVPYQPDGAARAVWEYHVEKLVRRVRRVARGGRVAVEGFWIDSHGYVCGLTPRWEWRAEGSVKTSRW